VLATPPSPGSSQAFASLISGWLGKVPPLPLNTVTAAFRAVYLCLVGRRLGSESHLIHSKLWSVILISVAKRKNPSNNSGGLGSWREQQQTIEINQKFVCRLTRPPQVSEGFSINLFRQLPHRRGDYKHKFSNFATFVEIICNFYVATLPLAQLMRFYYGKQ